MHLIVEEPHRTTVYLYLTQHLYVMILVTACSMEWDWRVFRAVLMLISLPELLSPFLSYYLLFHLLPSVGWLCGVGGLQTDSVHPLSPYADLKKRYNDNNNNNKIIIITIKYKSL